ncbi:MAG: GNAT family N-acetyltransferase [Pseudomonadota bacterium]|uniref:GNAT family N-acetyltransferase n=1 Tax=Gallaecimonas pentaromativorans TaxID=584787 RepID=UPI00067F3260|nr:GNAT family N-acetyltransferase [Gallaecimonas pentaromativorans]MED5526917.1 GNAT family N-acetyltransferase [Pseudomonadota bacterium]
MIREAQSAQDRSVILALWQAAAQQLDPQFAAPKWQSFALWLDNELLPQSQVFIYDYHGVQGFAQLKGRKLGALCVHPAAQGKGIGKALLYYTLSRFSDLEVQLFTAASEGQQYFKRQGFHPVQELLDSQTGLLQVQMVSTRSNRYFSY